MSTSITSTSTASISTSRYKYSKYKYNYTSASTSQAHTAQNKEGLFMKSGNIVYEKSFDFAVDILRLSKKLRGLNEYEIASQIMRSGTSIGANIAEAKYAQSSKDFISKMAIARKEANETLYWLRLITKAGILPNTSQGNVIQPLINQVHEIIRILTSIIKTMIEKQT